MKDAQVARSANRKIIDNTRYVGRSQLDRIRFMWMNAIAIRCARLGEASQERIHTDGVPHRVVRGDAPHLSRDRMPGSFYIFKQHLRTVRSRH